MKPIHSMIALAIALCSIGCEQAGAQNKGSTKPPGTQQHPPVVLEPALVVVIVSQGNPATVEAIARTRCDREKRCGHVGQNKKWPTEQACLQSVGAEWVEDLNTYECPKGVNPAELDECLLAIRNEDCGRMIDALERALACRSGEICKK